MVVGWGWGWGWVGWGWGGGSLTEYAGAMDSAWESPTGAKKMTNFWSRCLEDTSLIRSLMTPVPEPSIDFLDDTTSGRDNRRSLQKVDTRSNLTIYVY